MRPRLAPRRTDLAPSRGYREDIGAMHTQLQRNPGRSSLAVWAPTAWRRVLLLSVLFALMSLCHGVLLATVSASSEIGVDITHSDESPSHTVDCAADQSLLPPLEKRSDLFVGTTVDVASVVAILLTTAHTRETPVPLALPPGNVLVVLQIFRI